MARVNEWLGSWVLPKELDDAREYPKYDLYEDEKQNEHTFPQLTEELEPTQEIGNYCIGAEMLLP